MNDYTKNIFVKNLGASSTKIEYELISIKLFGKDVYANNVTQDVTTKTTKLYTQYPFNVSYTYDKTFLTGEYIDATSVNSIAKLNFNVSWPYGEEIINEVGQIYNYTNKDKVDTAIGKDAYAYYNNITEEEATKNPALEVKLRITSSLG